MIAETFKKYPQLFHKYILNLSTHISPIDYSIEKDKIISRQICHFHIHNVDKYADFVIYLTRIDKIFDIIITYNIGTYDFSQCNFTVLKVPNRGFDIGPKLCALKYIADKLVSYDYILFLHSKTNVQVRDRIYNPLIRDHAQLEFIERLMKNTNLCGIFPNWYFSEDTELHGTFIGNEIYFNEILNFLNVTNKKKEFAAGNCMILRKNILDRIFTPENLQIFYNMLNCRDSFDFNWYKLKHKLHNQSITDVYNHYEQQAGPGNNLAIMNTSASLPDCMIEHIFERIWINVISDMKCDYLILDSSGNPCQNMTA